ncbi:MAG: glucose-6-phosphate isomerase [Legionellaceae bacterium]|nr:glucose-6-phosphate isomerase [Legionellaceae bacterium]
MADEQVELNNSITRYDDVGVSHLTPHPEWSHLLQEFKLLRSKTLNQLFLEETFRHTEYRINVANIKLDYSLQLINKAALRYLIELCSRIHLKDHIDNLFSGSVVNHSEQRPALHTALRAEPNDVVIVAGENVIPKVQHTLQLMQSIANQIRDHLWLGYQGLPITDVVNIGIGGSDLGPNMAVHALKDYKNTTIGCHFLSDSDPDGFDDVVNQLNPTTTLFIVSSKSFTTHETLLNLKKAMQWLGTNDLKNHLIAVTANPEKALQCGIYHVLPIWNWVGGRYSFFSAINFILMVAIGPNHFQQLLTGAHAMDMHFKVAPLAQNMPVLLAVLGLWNLNFFCSNNHLMLVYSKRLAHFIPYIQQLDMESNGKSANIFGERINYNTGPIVWGGLGNHAEHAFYQLLYQGSHYTAGDFIFIGQERYKTMNQLAEHKLNALAFGVDMCENLSRLAHGNAGINQITLDELSPYTLGALVSLYEHKIYCQSVLWNINAFDQPGVEAAKKFKAYPYATSI